MATHANHDDILGDVASRNPRVAFWIKSSVSRDALNDIVNTTRRMDADENQGR